MAKDSMEELTGPPPPKYSLVDPEGGSGATTAGAPLLQGIVIQLKTIESLTWQDNNVIPF